MSKQKITSPHNHFTSSPHLYDDANLSLIEHRLISHYARVGDCYEAVRTTAKRCHMSQTSVIKARTGLADKGWITVGENDKGTIQVDVVNVWVLNSTIYGGPIKKPHQWVAQFEGAPEMERAVLQMSSADAPNVESPRSINGTKEDSFKKTPLGKKEPSVKNTLRKIAEDTFTAETGISPPKKKSEAGPRWWVPLRQICEIAEWDKRRIPLLIRAGIKYQDQKELSYDAPQSILKAVRYLISQEHRKKINIQSWVLGRASSPQIGKFLDDLA